MLDRVVKRETLRHPVWNSLMLNTIYFTCSFSEVVAAAMDCKATCNGTLLMFCSLFIYLCLHTHSHGCSGFTVQNDLCPEFDSRRLFSHESAEGGKLLCAHLKYLHLLIFLIFLCGRRTRCDFKIIFNQ